MNSMLKFVGTTALATAGVFGTCSALLSGGYYSHLGDVDLGEYVVYQENAAKEYRERINQNLLEMRQKELISEEDYNSTRSKLLLMSDDDVCDLIQESKDEKYEDLKFSLELADQKGEDALKHDGIAMGCYVATLLLFGLSTLACSSANDYRKEAF